jgi:peptidylprolyl isomerase
MASQFKIRRALRMALPAAAIAVLTALLSGLLMPGGAGQVLRVQAQGGPLRSDTYLDDTSLISGDPCAAPCFAKITPGQTTFNEAVNMIRIDTRFRDVQVQSATQASWSTAAGVGCCQMIGDANGKVANLVVRLAPRMTAGQLLAKYGDPTYTTVADYSATEVAVALIYPKNGFVAWVMPGDAASTVTESSPIVLAVYLAPEQFDSLIKTTVLSGWAGYKPYQTFKAATPIVTPLPPPTSAPLPTAVASADDLKSPCYNAPVPKVEPIANPPRQFSAPEKVTDPAKTYCGFIATEHGVIVMELYSKDAPQHVNSFAFLANKGYFDGITWHRVISGFVAQTGDPTGSGSGGPGYAIPLETATGRKYDQPGILGMARTNDPNSAGSQFFITYAPQPSLDPAPGGGYTIFGRVVRGLEVVQMIRPRDQGDPPGDKLVWARVTEAPAQ